jgi:hypothetical protein
MPVRRLGTWNCKYCDRIGISVIEFTCPGCSHPREQGVVFIPDPNGPIVTPEMAKILGSGGPNWYCLHCKSGNQDDRATCMDCGAPKGSSPSHKVKKYIGGQEPKTAEEAEAMNEDGKSWVDVSETENIAIGYVKTARSVPDQKNWVQTRAVDFVTSAQKSLGAWTLPALVFSIIVIFAAVFGISKFFIKHNENVSVQSFQWNNQIVTIEEFQVVHQTSWTNYPGDAYNVSSEYLDTGRDQKITDRWDTVPYQDTCYEDKPYVTTCTESEYVSKQCPTTIDNGDGTFTYGSEECGGYEPKTVSCTKYRPEPYTCTKTKQVEVFHYEDIWDNFYNYDVNRWITISVHPTSGNNHNPFYFSDFTLQNPYYEGNPQIGQQKKIETEGTYSVRFCGNNKKIETEGCFDREYPLIEWKEFQIERQYVIVVDGYDNIVTFPSPILK